MAYWTTIENPSPELLKSLFDAATSKKGPCRDCGARIGKPHENGCDVARCTICGGQDLSCNCGKKKRPMEIWDGVWPGVRTAYQEKLVCHGPDGVPIFDLNEVAARNAARREEP